MSLGNTGGSPALPLAGGHPPLLGRDDWLAVREAPDARRGVRRWGGTSAAWDEPAVVGIRHVRDVAVALRSRAGEPSLETRPETGATLLDALVRVPRPPVLRVLRLIAHKRHATPPGHIARGVSRERGTSPEYPDERPIYAFDRCGFLMAFRNGSTRSRTSNGSPVTTAERTRLYRDARSHLCGSDLRPSGRCDALRSVRPPAASRPAPPGASGPPRSRSAARRRWLQP